MQSIFDYITEHQIFTFLLSFLLGLIFMPFVLKLARREEFVVTPNRRTSHQGAIPNIGGLDIFFSFVITFLLVCYNNMNASNYILIGAFSILLVGFIDDLFDIKAWWKLIGQSFAVFFLIVVADIRITNLHGLFGIYELSHLFSYLFSFFVSWGIINAINLIDGVDGLASGLGILYSVVFALFFHYAEQPYLALLGCIIAGSLSVFFLYNVLGGSRRKIFMGDSGSLLLGYLLSLFVFEFLELQTSNSIPTDLHMQAAPAVAICIIFVPIFDTIRVIVTRIKKGLSPFSPDKNHIHHLLLKVHLSHVQVTAVLLLVSLFFVILGWFGRNLPILLLLLIAFSIATFLTIWLWRWVDKIQQKQIH